MNIKYFWTYIAHFSSSILSTSSLFIHLVYLYFQMITTDFKSVEKCIF